MTRAFAALVSERRGWSPGRIALFDAAFARYFARSAALARRTRTWVAPRIRHVAVVADPQAVRPYVQLLNTSAWMLYECDVDPALSDAELVAFLLVLGDRMAVDREVTTAAVRTAAWWLERSDAECRRFAEAAARSPRPDAPGLRAVAAATGWLRQLRHERLRPPRVVSPHRPIPGTGLLVPRALEAEPPALVACWTAAARRAVGAYHAAWRATDAAAVRALSDWLAGEAPSLLVTGAGGTILWDPEVPERLGPLRAALRAAAGVAVASIHADLQVVDAHSRAFHAALVDPQALPPPPPSTQERGYSYLHRSRRLIAYNLHEPGLERLEGPPLPYARAMLGARTAHEWGHLAAAAGWVARRVPPERFAELRAAFAVQLDAAITAAPAAVRRTTARELAAASPGTGLVRLFLRRIPDYQANLVARRFMSDAERETYARHNVRSLRDEYAPADLWRMLVRYLFEYQYLGPALAFTAVEDPRRYFLRSTWFAEDFLATGILDEARFAALAAAAARLCGCYAVDETRFRGT
jgi:hypothetical protein